MIFTETLTVHALAPFNFDLSAQIFSNGDYQICSYQNGEFHQALSLNGKSLLVSITLSGTTDGPELTIKVKSHHCLELTEKNEVKDKICRIFNLNFDLSSFYDQVEKDSVMHQLTRLLYGLKSPTTATVFESLVNSIIEQQISIKVARTIEQRLVKKFGESLIIDGNSYFVFPTPQNIAVASIAGIQQVGLSARKAEYIQNAAKLIVDGKLNLDKLGDYSSPEEISEELDKVRGIGVWTAEFTMLRGMQKLDAFPADDFGVRRVISTYYCSGKPIKSAEAREIAKAWGKWKGLAAFYLIIAEVKGILI